MLNILIYNVSYNLLFHWFGKKIPVFGSLGITSGVAAWLIAFSISFPAGFILSRHVVFPESNLHGRIQLFRYILATATFFLITYLLLKAFDYSLPMVNPTVRYTIICIITAVLSYISQRKFTFKTVDEDVVTD